MTLISVTKAAEILGVSRATAYRLAREGRIPCVRSIGPLRVHAEKLEALIDAEADASMAESCPPSGIATHQAGKLGRFTSSSQKELERELDELLWPTKEKR